MRKPQLFAVLHSPEQRAGFNAGVFRERWSFDLTFKPDEGKSLLWHRRHRKTITKMFSRYKSRCNHKSICLREVDAEVARSVRHHPGKLAAAIFRIAARV